MSNLKGNEKELYYFPVYCYRHFPSLNDGINEIIENIGSFKNVFSGKRDSVKRRKLEVYKNYETARQKGIDMLCDDDTYGVMCLEVNNRGFSSGMKLYQVLGKEIEEKFGKHEIELNLTRKDLKVVD